MLNERAYAKALFILIGKKNRTRFLIAIFSPFFKISWTAFLKILFVAAHNAAGSSPSRSFLIIRKKEAGSAHPIDPSNSLFFRLSSDQNTSFLLVSSSLLLSKLSDKETDSNLNSNACYFTRRLLWFFKASKQVIVLFFSGWILILKTNLRSYMTSGMPVATFSIYVFKRIRAYHLLKTSRPH